MKKASLYSCVTCGRLVDAKSETVDGTRHLCTQDVEPPRPCPEMAIAEREALALERIATALEMLANRGDIASAIYSAAEDARQESQSARRGRRHD